MLQMNDSWNGDFPEFALKVCQIQFRRLRRSRVWKERNKLRYNGINHIQHEIEKAGINLTNQKNFGYNYFQ
ncbi:Chaperone protein ClpB [Trichinella pseudospiralis]